MEIAEAWFELKEVKKSLTNVKKDLDELMSLYESWKFKFPHCTHDELLQHMKKVLKPAYDYLNRLFKEDGGDCCDIYKKAEACNIFNPLFLKTLQKQI